MQKHSPSTYNSGIVSSKNLVSFGSMINLSPKTKRNDYIKSYKDLEDKGFTSRNANIKSELNKTTQNFSYADRNSFKSAEKKPVVQARERSNISEWKPKSNNTFLKKK
jgi:hypothetical protein